MSTLAPRATLKQRLDRFARHLLVWLVGALFGVRKRPVSLPERPRIVVVRLDERVGNVIMTTAIAGTLKRAYPDAHVTFLGHRKNAALFAQHPWVDDYLVFDKRALLLPYGPLRTPFALRARRFDLAIDAANATDPSATQALLVRLSGARHTIGYDFPGFGRLFSAAVPPDDLGPHEIDMRVALTRPVAAAQPDVTTHLTPPAQAQSPGVQRLSQDAAPYALLNIGARLQDKRLSAETYAAVAQRVLACVERLVLTYGPKELTLAKEVCALAPGATLAPPTGLLDLAFLMARARFVVSCDTGPMHLAVATATPTCALFVSTQPERYGYSRAPHAAIDARGGEPARWLPELERWLSAHTARRAAP